ncbi:MAG: phosphoribosylglycinamide formyltransferase [Rikenellaceae bacterium]|jgi:phosphoribosylglycinamide formyltransferase-1|nr:phosphoribosylglycinamide formyltransferase [Rikenellaceae bacterium]
MTNIAVFASGSGSNAENIARYFQDSTLARVTLVVSDNPSAFVLERARNLGIEGLVFPRHEFSSGGAAVLGALTDRRIGYVVLAGFLRLVPPALISHYQGRIINIHPALLPLFGGKGMYGDRVHAAVRASGVTETGITIHHVNDRYDSGDIIAQYRIPIDPSNSPDDIARKVHQLEYAWFPPTIEAEIGKL